MDGGTQYLYSDEKSEIVPPGEELLKEDSESVCSKTKLEDKLSKEVGGNILNSGATGSNDEVLLEDSSRPAFMGEAVPELSSKVVDESKVGSDEENASLIYEVEHLELNTLCIGEPLAMCVKQFTSAVDSTVEKIKPFLLDGRSTQMKRNLSPGIFQVLSTVCSTFESVEIEADKVKCAVSLIHPDETLKLFYSFLAEVFRG